MFSKNHQKGTYSDFFTLQKSINRSNSSGNTDPVCYC